MCHGMVTGLGGSDPILVLTLPETFGKSPVFLGLHGLLCKMGWEILTP